MRRGRHRVPGPRWLLGIGIGCAFGAVTCLGIALGKWLIGAGWSPPWLAAATFATLMAALLDTIDRRLRNAPDA